MDHELEDTVVNNSTGAEDGGDPLGLRGTVMYAIPFSRSSIGLTVEAM